jgi:hypothetical protein
MSGSCFRAFADRDLESATGEQNGHALITSARCTVVAPTPQTAILTGKTLWPYRADKPGLSAGSARGGRFTFSPCYTYVALPRLLLKAASFQLRAAYEKATAGYPLRNFAWHLGSSVIDLGTVLPLHRQGRVVRTLSDGQVVHVLSRSLRCANATNPTTIQTPLSDQLPQRSARRSWFAL